MKNTKLVLTGGPRDKTVGVARMALGQLALVNDQSHLKTETWIHLHNCPMAFSVAVVGWAFDNDVQYIIARDNVDRVWMTTIQTMLIESIEDNLGCEDQFFLPAKFWRRMSWAELQLEPVLTWTEHRIQMPEAFVEAEC